MDQYSYQSYEEPRTASAQSKAIQSVQSWKNKKNGAKEEILASLNQAAEEKTANFKTSLNHTMAYAPQNHEAKTDAFKFVDVIDTVNPLHHLPIVGMAYRNLTGDKLHPMSGIIGGALYGGPVGAITGTANAITKLQTGKDIGEHAFEIVGLNKQTKAKTNERNEANTASVSYTHLTLPTILLV